MPKSSHLLHIHRGRVLVPGGASQDNWVASAVNRRQLESFKEEEVPCLAFMFS